MLFLILVAACALMPSPAHAGIEAFIGANVFAFLVADVGLSVTAGLLLTSTILTLGPLALLAGASLLLAPKQPSSVDPGAARDTFESAASPELRAVGRVRLGGLKVYGNSNVQDRYRLIAHCKGEIDGFESLYLNGHEVVVNSSGAATSFPWKFGEFTFATIDSKNGTGAETAWSALITSFPDHWTSSHRVRGIAQSLIKFVSPGFASEIFPILYQNGVPDLEVVVRAEKDVYDPRISDTQWTDNGVLNALHILLSYPERALADLDLEFVGAEADRADALIETLSGNVARSRCSGVWSSETPRGENFQRVLDSIGAWLVPREGGYKLGLQLIDDDPTADLTIPLRHIVEIVWKSGPEGVERPNLCRLKYYSPERNYEMAEVVLESVAWANIADEIEAYGEKPHDVELPFCPDSGQAQRRARQVFSLSRSDSGVVKTNMAGLAVWGCKVVNFEFPDDLGTIKCLIGAPKVLDNEGLVEIPFIVWPTLPEWDTEEHEVAAPERLPDITLGTAVTQPAVPAEATVVQYPNGSYETRVRYTLPVSFNDHEVVYQRFVGGQPAMWRPMTEVGTGLRHAYVAIDLRTEKVDFRTRINFENATSPWSPTLSVASLAINNTAPSAPSSAGGFAIAPNNLRVAYLRKNGGSQVPVRPGETTAIAVLPGDTLVAYSSNGTASSTYTVP